MQNHSPGDESDYVKTTEVKVLICINYIIYTRVVERFSF